VEPASRSAATRALDWAATLPFLLAFGGILLIFDPLQRVARLFGQRPQENVAGALQASLMASLRLCGTRLAIERSPLVAPHTPYILIANHQSMFDIPMFGALLFSNYPKYVSKRELARFIPSISYNLRRGGNALIDRGDRSGAEQVIRELGARSQRRGVSVVIYPEGTRARSGDLARFRPAGTLALLESAPALDVIPVTIDGSWHLLQNNLLPVPFGTRIRICFGDPIRRGEIPDDRQILERARGEIDRTLRAWRGENEQPPEA
jgi:1-acyl-sn-glycerol-3-phosphate acyltransferase